MNGLLGPLVDKTVTTYFAEAERRQIRKLKAKIEIAKADLEELEQTLSELQASLASRKQATEADEFLASVPTAVSGESQ